MRKIKIETWKAKDPKGKDIEENILIAINALISSLKPQEMPRGIEKYQIFNKLANAFDKANKTKVLEIEEREYKYLKGLIEEKIPASWALNENISKAVESFLNAKEE